MSLLICIVPKKEGFDTSKLSSGISDSCSDLFGFENTRKSLWGHAIINQLGCEIIYSLRSGNVHAFDKDVVKLKEELNRITDNITIISKETGYDVEFIKFRVNNAQEAIRIVESNIDTVGVTIG